MCFFCVSLFHCLFSLSRLTIRWMPERNRLSGVAVDFLFYLFYDARTSALHVCGIHKIIWWSFDDHLVNLDLMQFTAIVFKAIFGFFVLYLVVEINNNLCMQCHLAILHFYCQWQTIENKKQQPTLKTYTRNIKISLLEKVAISTVRVFQYKIS